MKNELHIDLETRSKVDISLGGYKYAEDCEIVIMACRLNDGPVLTWDISKPDKKEAVELYCESVVNGWDIIAHNASFEYAVLLNSPFPTPQLDRMRCSAAVCRAANIPASLDGAGQFLQIDTPKSSVGKRLIRIFSIPDSEGNFKDFNTEGTLIVDGTKMTYAEAWDLFVDYCVTDVKAECEIFEALQIFHLSETEQAVWRLTEEINSRGIPVNTDALNHANHLLKLCNDNLTARFKEITGLEPTMRDKVLKWLRDEGYPADNLQSQTVEDILAKPPQSLSEKGLEVLRLKHDSAYAAVKKIPAMLDRICNDGTIKGELLYSGASKTGRWSSRGVQFQNVKRPTVKNAEKAYEMLMDLPDQETLESTFNAPVQEILASTVRNFVEDDGIEILDSDYSNIEGRVGAWLVGEEMMLADMANGVDVYKKMAGSIYNTSYDQVSKDQRFVGKVAVLSCVYQTGAKKFHQTCADWGMPIDKQTAQNSVDTFRSQYSQFPKSWKAYHAAAVEAIKHPGKVTDVQDFEPSLKSIKMRCDMGKPFPMLRIKLPSGRYLCYPYPQVAPKTIRFDHFTDPSKSSTFDTDSISYLGKSAFSSKLQRISTYGGDLFQSVTQATARDLMANGLVEASKRGFEVFLLVHDQALAHYGDAEKFNEALCALPDWMDDNFPLVAEGGLTKFYSKD